jgi:hypothetical protein
VIVSERPIADHLIITIVCLVIPTISTIIVAVLDHDDLVGALALEKRVVGIVVLEILSPDAVPFAHGIINLGMVIALFILVELIGTCHSSKLDPHF